MVTKRVLRPERRRRVPKHFSWIDHRLVRDRHLERLGTDAAALYLFLLTVADADGVSFYADASIAARVALDEPRVHHARERLMRAELVAFEPPLYQVLELPSSPSVHHDERRDAGGLRAIADIIRDLGASSR